jgi:hypothetical protein
MAQVTLVSPNSYSTPTRTFYKGDTISMPNDEAKYFSDNPHFEVRMDAVLVAPPAEPLAQEIKTPEELAAEAAAATATAPAAPVRMTVKVGAKVAELASELAKAEAEDEAADDTKGGAVSA